MNRARLHIFPLAWLERLLLLFVLFPLPLLAQLHTNPPAAGATLKVINREVFVFRAHLNNYTPEQRATAAELRIKQAVQKTGGPRVDSQLVDATAQIRIHESTVFVIQPQDINALEGETFESVVEQTVQRLDQAASELKELHNHRSLLRALLLAVLATLLLAGLIWFSARNRQWIETQLIRLSVGRTGQIKSHTLRFLSRQNLVSVLRSVTTTIFWIWVIGIAFIWLEFVLRQFPFTRPFGEQMAAKIFGVLDRFIQSALQALPNLGIVLVVWALARAAASVARKFFAAVTAGTLKSHLFDPTTAPIAQRLAVILIWMTAIIVAFPYLPGSQTPAFRGISVMVGLMISLGSGSIIAQLVGGLVMVYNRTCRPGDYIRVDEHEGTVASIGFFTTRLMTVRNEEIVLPNSQISNSALINYSRLNETSGVTLPVKISIGYNTPWRQVQAMLLEAARRTSGLKPQPTPTVLQTTLSDFYVEYQLNTVAAVPAERVRVLSQLNANIQDVFNEYGVQILSPHYEEDPPQPAIVPKEKWHLPPAPPAS